MFANDRSGSALYRTIRAQPRAVRALVEGTAAEEIERAAEVLLESRRVFLIGTGTSGHAAVVGEHLLRSMGADAYATTNFEFVNYGRAVGPEDAVVAISHRGGKRYGRLAVERALAAGSRVVGVTGKGSPMEGPEVIVPTVEDEVSSTHTASYTTALTVLALLAARFGEGVGADASELQGAVKKLPDAITDLLEKEEEVRPVSSALAHRGRVVLVGAGPNAVTAREGALKIKESSYLVAEGFELETALHGGLQSVERGDVTVVIAAEGPAFGRTLDLLGALSIIGARPFVVADERVADRSPGFGASPDGTVVTYPAVPEPLSPALAVIPLQLLASQTAGLRGANPDSFRADDPVYRRANESYEL